MNWLAVVAGLISLTQSLIRYLSERKLIDQTIAKQALKSNEETLNAISRAKKAKDAITAAANRDPDSIMRDDEFKRPDK